jgi:hypothetical protein
LRITYFVGRSATGDPADPATGVVIGGVSVSA